MHGVVFRYADLALNVLVTMRFNEAQLDRLRQVSPEVRVMREDLAGAPLLNIVDRARGY